MLRRRNKARSKIAAIGQSARAPARKSDEGPCLAGKRSHSCEILDAKAMIAPRGDDAVDDPRAEARHAQKDIARSGIDVDREKFPISQCPGCLRIELKI